MLVEQLFGALRFLSMYLLILCNVFYKVISGSCLLKGFVDSCVVYVLYNSLFCSVSCA